MFIETVLYYIPIHIYIYISYTTLIRKKAGRAFVHVCLGGLIGEKQTTRQQNGASKSDCKMTQSKQQQH